MKNLKKLKTISLLLALGIMLSVCSSCNRGAQGCPNNFSINPTFSIPFVK